MNFTYSFMFHANSVVVAFSVSIRPKMQDSLTGDVSNP